jgi:dihydropyrimidinase
MAEPYFDLVLTGGTVANADGSFRADVAIRDGRVAEVWPAGSTPKFDAAQVRDCTGMWIIPGGVDPHVHVGITFGDVITEEGHAECTRAALAGGTTTIVDFAIPKPGQDPLSAVLERQEGAQRSAVTDYVLHGCFTDAHAGDLDQIDELVRLGVRTIKVYTTYRGELMADDKLIAEVMRRLRPHQGLTYVHAEDNTAIETLMAELAERGPIPYEKIVEARPESAENAAVAHVLGLARENDAPVYFVHQSTATALELTRAARAAGVPAYSEVCPHYTLLDESVYAGRSGEHFTCCRRGRPWTRSWPGSSPGRWTPSPATTARSGTTTRPRTRTSCGRCRSACRACRPGCRSCSPSWSCTARSRSRRRWSC